MIVAAGNYLAAVLTAKIGRSIRILADAFDDDDHCISATANFLNMPQATTNDALHGNWLTDILDSDMGYLNK